METRIIYSYMYNRQLNFHKSREQVWKRFQELEGSCVELQELCDRFLLGCIYKMEEYVGEKIPREEIRVYIMDRDRGGSFHEPVSLQYDDDQKFMFAELLHLVGHHLIFDRGALGEGKINLLIETILSDLPLNFSREISRLHKNQQNRYPEYFRMDPKMYDLKAKSMKEHFPPIEKKEERKPNYFDDEGDDDR